MSSTDPLIWLSLVPEPNPFPIDGAEARSGQPDVNTTNIVLRTATAVPEPSSLVMAGLGLVGLMGYAGWRRKRDGRSSTRINREQVGYGGGVPGELNGERKRRYLGAYVIPAGE